MVKNFVEHVICPNSAELSACGHTSSYYSSIEQQSRLTLHLYLVIWIKNSLSLQEIKNQLIAGDSEFQWRLTDKMLKKGLAIK